MILEEISSLSQALSPGAIAICLFLIPLIYSFTLVIYRLYFHPLRRYPGPLLARATNLYAFYHAWKGDKHQDIYKLHKIYGDFVRVQPGTVSINQNSAIKDIYGVNRNVQKGFLYHAASVKSGGVNTFNSIDRTVHSHKRRSMASCFTDHALRINEDSMLPIIRRFLTTLSGDGRVPWEGEMSQWSTYLVFDVMGRLSFGKDFGMLSGPENRPVAKLIESNTHITLMAGTSRFVLKWGLDKLLSPSVAASSGQLLKFVGDQVEERRLKSDDTAFLDHLMAAKEKDGSPSYPDQSQINAEARSLVVAGSDTTATQLAANFFYLSTNRANQATLAREIRSTFASVEDIRHGPELDSCKYLHAFIEETLRMAPSVPGIIPREVLPGGITVSGQFFPAGAEISVPIYALHHNEAYYDEPHKHKPERWLPEVVGKEAVEKSWSAFTPFSHGSRTCVGKKLAYMELWITVARAVWMFDMEYRGGGREEAFGEDVMEYKLIDHLTSFRTGPTVRFVKRAEE